MNAAIERVIRDVFTKSNNGEMHFGQVVGALFEAGVESYQVDYRANRATYYTANETLTLEMTPPDVDIAEEFSTPAIKSAILEAQRGKVMYPEFKRISQAGGCTGYVVWISGRHVTYFGRKGETHIEKFPD